MVRGTGKAWSSWRTMRYGSAAKVLAKRNLEYYRISECGSYLVLNPVVLLMPQVPCATVQGKVALFTFLLFKLPWQVSWSAAERGSLSEPQSDCGCTPLLMPCSANGDPN